MAEGIGGFEQEVFRNPPKDDLEIRLGKNLNGDAVDAIEKTFDDLMTALGKDPTNTKLVREVKLLINRLDDLSAQLKRKIQH